MEKFYNKLILDISGEKLLAIYYDENGKKTDYSEEIYFAKDGNKVLFGQEALEVVPNKNAGFILPYEANANYVYNMYKVLLDNVFSTLNVKLNDTVNVIYEDVLHDDVSKENKIKDNKGKTFNLKELIEYAIKNLRCIPENIISTNEAQANKLYNDKKVVEGEVFSVFNTGLNDNTITTYKINNNKLEKLNQDYYKNEGKLKFINYFKELCNHKYNVSHNYLRELDKIDLFEKESYTDVSKKVDHLNSLNSVIYTVPQEKESIIIEKDEIKIYNNIDMPIKNYLKVYNKSTKMFLTGNSIPGQDDLVNNEIQNELFYVNLINNTHVNPSLSNIEGIIAYIKNTQIMNRNK